MQALLVFTAVLVSTLIVGGVIKSAFDIRLEIHLAELLFVTIFAGLLAHLRYVGIVGAAADLAAILKLALGSSFAFCMIGLVWIAKNAPMQPTSVSSLQNIPKNVADPYTGEMLFVFFAFLFLGICFFMIIYGFIVVIFYDSDGDD